MPQVLGENEVRLYIPSEKIVKDLWNYVFTQEAAPKGRAGSLGHEPIGPQKSGLADLVRSPKFQRLSEDEIAQAAEGISLRLNGYFSTLGRRLTLETNQELRLIYQHRFSQGYVGPAKKMLLQTHLSALDKMAAEIESQVQEGPLGNGVYWLFYRDEGVWLKPGERASVQMRRVLPTRPMAKVISGMSPRRA